MELPMVHMTAGSLEHSLEYCSDRNWVDSSGYSMADLMVLLMEHPLELHSAELSVVTMEDLKEVLTVDLSAEWRDC